MERFFVLFIETLFFAGMAGSLVVVLLAFVGDIHVLFERDRREAPGEGD